MDVHLTEISIYPVKSTRRVGLYEAVVEQRGLRGDRRWMLVDDAGVFISQRDQPTLALVQTHLDADGLAITGPEMPTLKVSSPVADGARMHVRVWRDMVDASIASAEADEWFSRFLGRPTRLVYMDDSAVREVDSEYAVDQDDQVSFADGYPLLITSEESLMALNERTDLPIPMNRFRPNLVIAGAAPFAEDAWRQIMIGDVRFNVVKGSARCTVTTIDQETARQGKEPLRTLSRFRNLNGNVYFGQNLIPAGEGPVRLGDAVRVIA